MSQRVKIREWAINLKKDVGALYLAYQQPTVPLYAKIWLACVVAYALSPIDLIPDFIPVLGHLDDLILLPLGIWIAMKLIPTETLVECRDKATKSRMTTEKPTVTRAHIDQLPTS